METPNRSIKCTLRTAATTAAMKTTASLSCITVGTHEMNPTQDACTDCMSYVKK